MFRPAVFTRIALLAGAAFAIPQLFACLSHPVKDVEYDKAAEDESSIAININKDVDILFVIDNSGSMAEEQRTLSENFGAFIGVLEAEDVNANYRIGVTTSDMGNPRCGPTADGGDLLLSSCRGDRLDPDFRRTTQGGDLLFDARFACEDFCSQETHDILAAGTTETESGKDDGKKSRRWIERIEGEYNLPEGVNGLQAFQCFGPQGITGCGFESQLEAMYKALKKAQSTNKDEINYGFLRDSAILSVVVVTDEADCSYNPAFDDIFTPGNKTFWSDMGANAAQNAVCWNAGTKCSGGGPFQCESADYGADGAELDDGSAAESAVLYPVERYKEVVQEIEDQKQLLDQGQEVLVALIGGVPLGYEEGGDINYVPDQDPDAQIDNGIGPGCTSQNQIMVDPTPCTGTEECPAGSICTDDGTCGPPEGNPLPPVRMVEWAEAFAVDGARNIYSICSEDYTSALNAIANRIRDQIKPACFPGCVADTNRDTPYVDANCALVEENDATGEQNKIPECIDQDGERVPPVGETVCFDYLVDKDGNETPNEDDDMDPECVEKGYNLEFRIVRSASAKAGFSVKANCELSDLREVDCPTL